MAHINAILSNIANAAARQRYEERISTLAPRIGRFVFPAGMVDMQLGKAISAGHVAFPYQTIEGYDPNTPVEVAHCILGECSVSGDPSEWAGTQQQALQTGFRMTKALAELGVYAGLYQHYVDTPDDRIQQIMIYVPVIRPEEVPPVNLRRTQTNLPQEALFLAYLMHEGVLDIGRDRAGMTEAVSAYGVRLAEEKHLPALRAAQTGAVQTAPAPGVQ